MKCPTSTKTSFVILLLFALSWLIISGCSLFVKPASNIHLPAIFSDNMVLQRDIKIPVFGTANPGGKVMVKFEGKQQSAKVSKDGTWQIDLGPHKAGGPFELTIFGQDTLTFKNVMVGEVWLASGQSNMEMPLAGGGMVLNYEQEIAAANYPNIRLFHAEHIMSNTPLKDVTSAGWKECSPETVPLFSSVAYFFGRHLYNELDIPIGLVHSSWGGTPAEAWTSKNSLEQFPEFVSVINELEENDGNADMDRMMDVYREKLADWQTDVKNLMSTSNTLKQGWQNPQYDDSQWGTMPVPSIWETQGLKVDGIVWFRKDINIPDEWQGQDLKLALGPINDFDVTWFNGKEIGSEAHVNIPRNYNVPSSLVEKGKNSLVVQVLDIGNVGGIFDPSGQLSLINPAGDSISLAGPWRYKVDPFFPNLDNMPNLPGIPMDQNRPTVLFNAMISPLIPYAIRGAIWYQGESNAGRAYQYRTLFPALIQDWRSHWGQGDFYFLFVQLANFMGPQPTPEDDAWAELREAQLLTLSLPNTGMAVTIDIGEERDIHPKNKQDVGKRLALNAMNLVYGQDVEYSGPIYKSKTVDGDKIKLIFDHVGEGLAAKDNEKLLGFAIAGEDKKFTWADAVIDGETVLVSSPYVSKPVAVRYAWAINPICNLYNKAGLPASPFRTDEWDGITKGIK